MIVFNWYYFLKNLSRLGHLMRRTDSLEKTLILGKIEGRREGDNRGLDGGMASLTRWWRWVWVGSGNWWWTGKPGMLQSMGSQRVRHNWAAELNWDLKYYSEVSFFLPTQYQPQPYVYINEDFKKKKKSTKAPGVGYGQGSRACCSPWGCKESDTTEWLNWTNWWHLTKYKTSTHSVLAYVTC